MKQFFIPIKILGFYSIKQILNNNNFFDVIKSNQLTFKSNDNTQVIYKPNDNLIFIGLQKTEYLNLNNLTEENLNEAIYSLMNQKIKFLTHKDSYYEKKY